MTTKTDSPLQTLHRPGSERFHSRLDWLDSWHSFSFSNHYDPAWMGFGPLRVINDDTIAAGKGFGLHPHNDMEIITVMVEGELSHQDSMGHSEVLQAGEVQRMSAGTGLVHSEMNHSGAPCRLLQIWIEPSHRGIEPSYEQKPFVIGGGWTPLLDPERRDGALAIDRPVRLWRAQPEEGKLLELPLVAGRSYWVQVIDGAARLGFPTGQGEQTLGRGDGFGFTAGGATEGTSLTGLGGLHRPRADLLLFELDGASPG